MEHRTGEPQRGIKAEYFCAFCAFLWPSFTPSIGNAVVGLPGSSLDSPLASANEPLNHRRMRPRTISILVGIVLVGESATFSGDFQFRHHFISRELPIRDKSLGDYGLTALVDADPGSYNLTTP